MTPTPLRTRSAASEPSERAAALKAIIDGASYRLTEQLKEGHTGEYRRMLRFWPHFHQYSHGNIILVLSQLPDATQVAGYTTWRKLGRQVGQGARSISIWCPILKTIEDPETKLDVDVDEFGQRALFYDGVALYVDDFINDTQVPGSGSVCSSVYGVKLGARGRGARTRA